MLETKLNPKQKTQNGKGEILYPESDGKPMAETDTHRDLMSNSLINPLQDYFRDNPDIYVSGNLLLYYVEGNPRKSVSPDVLVTFGIPKGKRRIYKLWEEGKMPDVVFELTSNKTYRQNLEKKRFLYERLGITEYFLFDPLRDYLNPPLIGFRLLEGFYIPIQPTVIDSGELEMTSQVLNLVLRTAGDQLRLFDPQRKQYLLTTPEVAEARRQSELNLTQERLALQEAEAEITRLRTLLADKDSS